MSCSREPICSNQTRRCRGDAASNAAGAVAAGASKAGEKVSNAAADVRDAAADKVNVSAVRNARQLSQHASSFQDARDSVGGAVKDAGSAIKANEN